MVQARFFWHPQGVVGNVAKRWSNLDTPRSLTFQITYLKLASQHIYCASVFIVCTSVLPNVAYLFFQGIPRFVERCTSGFFSALLTVDPLFNLFQRDRVLDSLIIVRKGAGWEIDEIAIGKDITNKCQLCSSLRTQTLTLHSEKSITRK